jgi:molybdate transport system ATP-binding protein
MSLQIDLRFVIGPRAVHAALTTEARRIAIVGASGIGKTTLLRAISGTLDGVRGGVTLDGVALDDVAIERRRIGWAPQDAVLFPHLTVRQNVAFAARESTAALSTALGLDGLLDRSPRGLSGGERQRVAIARALAARPKLILLDEPLSALDRPARAEVASVIEGERSKLGATLLLVAHDEADLSALVDEAYVLDASGTLTAR